MLQITAVHVAAAAPSLSAPPRAVRLAIVALVEIDELHDMRQRDRPPTVCEEPPFFCDHPIVACAATSRAMGTRKGEQLT